MDGIAIEAAAANDRAARAVGAVRLALERALMQERNEALTYGPQTPAEHQHQRDVPRDIDKVE